MDGAATSSTSPASNTTPTTTTYDPSLFRPAYIPAYPPLSRHSLSPSSATRPTTASTSNSTSPSFTSLPTTSLFSPSPALEGKGAMGLISPGFSAGGGQGGGGGGGGGRGRARSIRWSIQPSVEGPTKLRRQLRSRHIAMISLGGVIGTGLFLGSAQSLQKAGPLGLLLAFTIMGVWVWCMMISLYLPLTLLSFTN